MEVEELIEKKKAEIIAEVKKESEGRCRSILEEAVEELEEYVAKLKMAKNITAIGGEEALKVIEKGGYVLKKEVNVEEDHHRSVSLEDFMEGVIDSEYFDRSSRFDGKQIVTIIIEPAEE